MLSKLSMTTPEPAMSASISTEQLLKLAPDCHPLYRAAFGLADAALSHYGISASAARLAHFVAQVMHETGGLTLLTEDLDYSAERLRAVWPLRFAPRGMLDANDYAHRPEALAEAVYGGRLGNSAPGDGYKFRGRGILQLTGKDSYARVTTSLSEWSGPVPDFRADPDAVLSPSWCVAVGTAHWHLRRCNEAADRGDLATVARLLNGGEIGLRERAR
ncbi:MAG: glycoside hydrolase family 19 protein, partial [Gammaproteobacteria bacterium]